MRTPRSDTLAQNTRAHLNPELLEDRAVPAASRNATLFAVGTDTGGESHVNVFNADGSLRFSFVAFPGYNGGVRVATGDVNGDGTEDIVVGAGPGATGGHVKVFDGESGNLISSFFAFDGFAGGVNAAVG